MTQPTRDRKAYAVELLDALGPTKDDVARTLQSLGCLGQRDLSCSCPIAVYLRWSDLGCTAANVSDDEIAIHFGEITGGCGEQVIYVITPDPVAAFIVEFDLGGYPKLAAA